MAHLFGLADLGDIHQIQNSVLLDQAALTQLSTTSRAISRALRAYSTIRLRASKDSLHIHAAIHQIQMTNFIRVMNEAFQSCLSMLYFDDFSRLFRPQPIPHRYHLLGSHTDSDSLTLIIQAVTYSRYVPVQSKITDTCTSFLTLPTTVGSSGRCQSPSTLPSSFQVEKNTSSPARRHVGTPC